MYTVDPEWETINELWLVNLYQGSLVLFQFFFLHAHSKVNKEIKHLIWGEDPLVHSVNWYLFSFSVVVVGFYNDASVQPGNNKKQVEKCRGDLAKALGQWSHPTQHDQSDHLGLCSITFQWTCTVNCSPTSRHLARY